MERCFILNNKSEFVKDYEEYTDLTRQQMEFAKQFMKDKGIESTRYYVRGNGFMNVPFEEHDKSDICFYIMPTENDLKKFGKMLNKPNEHGLNQFRKSSKISKEFAQQCVDNNITINLWSPRVGDYFNSIRYSGYSRTLFNLDDTYYLSIRCEHLKEDDTPKGFTEIKQSEFYLKKEEYESKKD